eukprot:scaffold83841_cov69-Phaeocystis_antarctica.AAC.2
METPKRAPADPAKRATALAAVLGWLLSLAAARAEYRHAEHSQPPRGGKAGGESVAPSGVWSGSTDGGAIPRVAAAAGAGAVRCADAQRGDPPACSELLAGSRRGRSQVRPSALSPPPLPALRCSATRCC